MKLLSKIISVILILTFAAACTHIKPLTATGNPIGSKTGEASTTLLFGILPLGNNDHSIQNAALEGGITEISTVDVKETFFWFIIGFTIKYTTIVTGE